MTAPRNLVLALAMLAATGGLAACTPAAPPSRASTAARTACRGRAEQVFEQQNRGAIYREDTYVSGLRDTPFGSSGLGSVVPTSLADQFDRNRTLQDCLNGTGTATDALAPATK